MNSHRAIINIVFSALLAGGTVLGAGQDASGKEDLAKAFVTPPPEARLHAYWWWLNGNVTAEAITRDLEEMKKKGFIGALITDAGGAEQDGNRQVPHGPDFASPKWRELYRHALREGMRLGMELSLNIQSGWNLGGPGVKPEDAAKILCWSETETAGPGQVSVTLPLPRSNRGFVKDVVVLAVPEVGNALTNTIRSLPVKTLMRPVGGANTDLAAQLAVTVTTAKVAAVGIEQVVDVSKFMNADGQLTWTAPAGNWRIFRFCFTVSPSAHVSTCSRGWEGLALDPMDAGAFQRYWDSVVEPLMADMKEVGARMKYLHTDSWEIEPFNWTVRLPDEFRRRCGYDMTPWLPVFAGRVVTSLEASERFLHDFRKTVAEVVAENYYGPFLENAHRHGLQVRAESGGPHGVPIDAQHCLGIIDVPMSEFWATSWRHRVPLHARFFVKQPASAAHTYGRQIVAAEGFTTIGPHWQETVWDNLKPNFDLALCEGLNQLVWTLVTCSPKEMGFPGQEMFPGTHFNPNSTWWSQSEGFLSYINRCQWMLRQGLFVADVLYYYGDLAPNFAGLKSQNPARLPKGYDYDVASEYVLLNRLAVKDGRLVLPDGMSYAALVLPSHSAMSLQVLRKLDELSKAGGVIIGPRPVSSSGPRHWQREGDQEARGLIDKLWGGEKCAARVKGMPVADWLRDSGLQPDVILPDGAGLDWIHRRGADGTEIYFICNQTAKQVDATAGFRVTGKQPELWDAVTGEIRALTEFRTTKDGGMEVPLRFEPFQSWFVVFKKVGTDRRAVRSENGSGGSGGPALPVNMPELKQVAELGGAWDVQFDAKWFYPDNGTGGKVRFEQLADWTSRPEDAIKYYSGAATYKKIFDANPDACGQKSAVYLDLGAVREMARVSLNGRALDVVWCAPWRVKIPAGVLKEKGNELAVEAVNFWPNRLIGDAKLSPEQRRTQTNITKFEHPKGDSHYTILMPSGLLGPVRLMAEAVSE